MPILQRLSLRSAMARSGLFFLLLSGLLLSGVAEAGNILFFGPFVSKSMVITYTPILKELAKHGHKVTVVSANPMGKTDPNIREIVPENNLEKTLSKMSESQLKGNANPFDMLKMLTSVFEMVDACFGHQDMQALLNDPATKFDAVIVIPFFGNEAGYYLAHRFKAPLILYFTGQASLSWVDDAMGQPHNTAYLPTAILPFTTEMTFSQRVINTFGNFVFHKLLRNVYILGNDMSILQKHFPDEEIPDLIEIEKNASLTLGFNHPLIMDGWRPHVPNYVSVGMMNCRPAEKLPPDNKIGQFLDGAKEGVVYVSFGSVISASLMSEEKRLSFLAAFSKLKQKVLWKWETETMADQPANVMLSKWLPQQEVLAHPNVKLFITHGGQSSFQETLCHKKPVIVIPVTGDQPANAAESVRLGLGLTVHFRDVNADNLFDALQQVLNDPKYGEVAQELGSNLVDQINRPLDRAVWWIEHVMRHPTLYVRRSPVHNLAWYQHLLLDVYAFFVAVLALLGLVTYKIAACCCCRRKRADAISGTKKKN